jgi:tRNA dimethylallyltransferase
MDELDERIAQRTRLMFDQGLVEETRELDRLGLRHTKTAAKATGYAQALAVIDGEMTIPEAIDSVALATRQLARRQVKWLRRDPRIVWIDRSGEGARTSAEAALQIAREVVLSAFQ